MKNIYDWGDFLRMAGSSNLGKVKVFNMQFPDFKQFVDKFAKAKVSWLKPKLYLKDMVSV